MRRPNTLARLLACAAIVVASSAQILIVAPPAVAEAPKVSAWLPYWDHTEGLRSFTANASQYSILSPFWYRLEPTGAISAYSGAPASAVVDAAVAAGVPLLPAISNEFDGVRVRSVIGTSAARASHVAAIVDLVRRNGFAGIDIDYESLAASDRTAFTAFVQELGAALHGAGKKLSVTVHPKTSEPGTWDGPQAQDYAAIGAVADIVRPMAYDYHWSTSAPGAIAPASWVDQVAKFTASVISPSKVQLGLPLYGYDWVGNRGTGVVFAQVQSLLSQTGATRQWSATDQAPWFTYTKDGVTHTVWYEDAQSIAAKLQSVDRYGLAGSVFWRLGGEDAAVWNATATRWQGAPDTGLPTVAIVSPKPNAKLTVPYQKVAWTSSDDRGVTAVKIWLDGILKATSASPASSISLATGSLARGKHQIRVTAYDAAGNSRTANVIVYRR